MPLLFHVFIDTGAFEDASFLLSDPKKNALVTLSNEGNLQLYLTSITIGEIKNRIPESTKNICDQLIGLKKCPYLTDAPSIAKFGVDSAALLQAKNTTIRDSINSDILGLFDKLLSDVKAKTIPLNDIDNEELAARYLKSLPPFSVAEGKDKKSNTRKKYEFPDALAILAINRYAINNNITFHVVSNDSDFMLAKDDFVGIADVHISIEALIGMIVKEVNEYQYNRVMIMARNNISAFCEEIKNIIHDEGVVYPYWDDEFELTEISDITIDPNFIDIIEVDSDYAELYFAANVTIEGEVSYRDEEMSLYDKEDGKYIIEEFKSSDFEETQEIKVSAKIIFDKDSQSEDFDIVNVVINDGKGITLTPEEHC